MRAGDRTFREGDRVIQLRNDYDKWSSMARSDGAGIDTDKAR